MSPADVAAAPPARGLSGRKLIVWSVVLAGVLLAVVGACSLVGVAELSRQVWTERLGRLAVAAIVGASLAVAGVALQSLLRNPLASPFILGVSSGAGVGVLVGLVLVDRGLGTVWMNKPAMAAAGALTTMAVVYLVAQRRGLLDPFTLLLTGVIVNAFNGAICLLLYLLAGPKLGADYVMWSMGSVPELANDWLILVSAGLTVAGWLFVISRGQAFNVQSLGDDVAASSGVNIHILRAGTFVVVSLMTAAAVSLAGPIGFVGLIIPHVCRMIFGSDHRLLAVASGFVGAIFLAGADTFVRSTVLVFGMGELPLGLVTAFLGGPFFIFLLRRRYGEVVE